MFPKEDLRFALWFRIVVWTAAATLLVGVDLTLALAQDGAVQCGPMPSLGVHECHCPHMIEAAQAKYAAECRRLPDNGAREQCLNSRPETCDIMDHPGNFGMEQHPDQCLNKCVPHKCTCNEGACARPPRAVKPPKRNKLK